MAPPPNPQLDPSQPEAQTSALAASSDVPWATLTIVVLNAALYAAMEASGSSESLETLLVFGAKANDRIAGSLPWDTASGPGEWWRLCTSFLLHAGHAHLLVNTAGLWFTGAFVERAYGRGQLVLAYVIAGLCGTVASYHLNPDTIMVGASGAIYGLTGVLLVFGARYRSHVDGPMASQLAIVLLSFFVVTIATVQMPTVDNAAHVGGLASGALVGTLLTPAALMPARARRRTDAVLTSAGAGLVVTCLAGMVLGRDASFVPARDLLLSRITLERMEVAHGVLTDYLSLYEQRRSASDTVEFCAQPRVPLEVAGPLLHCDVIALRLARQANLLRGARASSHELHEASRVTATMLDALGRAYRTASLGQWADADRDASRARSLLADWRRRRAR